MRLGACLPVSSQQTQGGNEQMQKHSPCHVCSWRPGANNTYLSKLVSEPLTEQATKVPRTPRNEGYYTNKRKSESWEDFLGISKLDGKLQINDSETPRGAGDKVQSRGACLNGAKPWV